MADNSSDEYEDENNKEKKKTSQLTPQRGFSENDDDDDDDDSSETDSDDDDDEHGAPLEGYTPQLIDLDHKLKPFIPDFIPAVGDIDAFLKVPRPDGKPDNLGLLVLDEPSTKQSDPTVLSLWLTENSKQHNITQHMKVKSLEDAEKNPKAIDTWIESISELHRSKPPATVHYTRPMPDIDTLMQEWSPEFEELLGKVSLPTAEIDCSLAEYIDMICAILDIPVYKSRIQSLHLLFSLYSEFKNSQVRPALEIDFSCSACCLHCPQSAVTLPVTLEEVSAWSYHYPVHNGGDCEAGRGGAGKGRGNRTHVGLRVGEDLQWTLSLTEPSGLMNGSRKHGKKGVHV
uniref:Intraflagellar transport protein 46 homolog n=1 Tax=Capra hircus TaxID=9925 RepID=A0A8C2RPW7_CAPHI